MSEKLWKEIPGFSDYEVSEDGRVRRVTPCRTRNTPYELKGNVDTRGYLRFKISRNGEKITIKSHVLVLLAFKGARPDGMWGLHKDDNKLNNKIENLYWGTPLENHNDRRRNGRSFSGEKNGRSILTEKIVASMRLEQRVKYGDTSKIARKYGVSYSQAKEILDGHSWHD